jgi:4-hydroxy-3-methylbut-2-enyl diphosphate reductase IspH
VPCLRPARRNFAQAGETAVATSDTRACRHDQGQVFCEEKVKLMVVGLVQELHPKGLILKEKIGLSSGASTPSWFVKSG